jgi:hypothetical protein
MTRYTSEPSMGMSIWELNVLASRLRWVSMTPFDAPVVPPV